MNRRIVTGVLVGCLLAFVAVFAFAQTGSNVRWEYTTLRGFADLNIERVNQLGQDGWQLVATQETNGILLIFKRRLP